MPIKIFKSGESDEEIAWLCDDDWELPIQISALERWLQANASLEPNNYVADIGYSVRKDASGGGGVFTLDMMRVFVTIGMEVYFSEYPWGDD